MDYKKLIKRLKYYETTYAIGENLGREIDGTDQLLSDAATAIETLLAEREAARWISAKDRIPKSVENKVLVFCKNGYVGFGHYEDYKGVQTWFNLESGKSFFEWAHDDPDDYDVTHWMPLPTPPDRKQTES